MFYKIDSLSASVGKIFRGILYLKRFLHLEAGIWGFSADILINRMYCSTLCASYLVSKLKCLKACDESKTFFECIKH